MRHLTLTTDTAKAVGFILRTEGATTDDVAAPGDVLTVQFPTLSAFAGFVLRLTVNPSTARVAHHFAADVRNICHDSYGIEVEFRNISAAGIHTAEVDA